VVLPDVFGQAVVGGVVVVAGVVRQVVVEFPVAVNAVEARNVVIRGPLRITLCLADHPTRRGIEGVLRALKGAPASLCIRERQLSGWWRNALRGGPRRAPHRLRDGCRVSVAETERDGDAVVGEDV
jgi:hypothetical protein